MVINLCLASFAAVISDNDGAAFITKAEFEALKKDFSAQVDSYNNSIDNKIDGAIAAYLAGLRLSDKTQVKLPYADWEYVTSLNYDLENEYWYPNTSLTVTMLASMFYDLEIPTNPIRFGYESWWAFTQLLYQRPSSTNSKRLLCDAGTEGTTYPDDIIWKGLANDYTDNITLLRTYLCNSHDNADGYLWGSMTDSMTLCHATNIKNGYFSNLSTEIYNVWEPKYFWMGQNGANRINVGNDKVSAGCAAGYRAISDIYNSSNTTSIELKKVNNKTTSFDHIINYNNVSYDYFSDVDWLKTFTTITDNTLTRETWLQVMTSKIGKYANLEFWNQGHLLRTNDADPRLEQDYNGIRVHTTQNLYDIVSGNGEFLGGQYRWADKDKTDNTTIISVGLIPKNYDSEHIKQTEKGFSQVVDNNQYDGQVLNLYNGFALLAAKTDDVIEWNPVFIDTYSNNVETDFEIKVQLALEPFGEGNTVSSTNKYIILDGDITATPKETSDGKCNIKFTMPTNGIVYVKWWPASSTIEATDWRATLDLTQSGTYTREVS